MLHSRLGLLLFLGLLLCATSIDAFSWRKKSAAETLRDKTQDFAGDINDAAINARKKGAAFKDAAADGIKQRQRDLSGMSQKAKSAMGRQKSTLAQSVDGVTNKFKRSKRDDYADYVDGSIQGLKKKGQQYYADTADTLKGKKQSYSESFDEAADKLKTKGKKFSGDAADKLKQKRQEYAEDAEEESEGWNIPIISGIADKFRGKSSEDLGEDFDEQADSLKKKGKQYAADASDKLKGKKQSYSESFDEGVDKLKKKGQRLSKDASKKAKEFKNKM